ncbi:MAG TPA: hypothetical protein VEJ18_02030, partial [Planctomycetota bacterium]|nr:hypothetical protein [Planctomycetota bacterium]
PALARAVLDGHVREGTLVAARRAPTDALFEGVDVLQQDFTGGGYDAKALKGNLATPAEVLAIGRVTAKFGDGLSPATKTDWNAHWDREKKIVRSATGELAWDYGRRVVTLTAARSQAVVGFAGGSSVDLPAARIDVKTPFVSVILTSLDDRPLPESKHILVTAMAQDRQAGTEYGEDFKTLVKAGGPPLYMEPVQATITLKGAPPSEVRSVDLYGVPTAVKLPVSGGAFAIDGRYRAYYYQIKR